MSSSSSKSRTTKVNPQMLIKETLAKTKKLFHKTFKNLKGSLILVKYQQHPTNPTPNPISSYNGNKDSSKLEELDNSFYRSYSEKWDAIEVKKKKDEQISTRSISFADCSRGLEGLNEDKHARKHYGKNPKESMSFGGADHILAQKMKDLEMMDDVNDMDHVLDVEEVLHYYSRLYCPTYVEIVDKFFMDMYLELNVPQPSRSGSMRRKLGSAASAHSSMRSSLGPLKLYTES